MEQELQRIKAEALDAIKDAADQQALQDIRVKYLGKNVRRLAPSLMLFVKR